MVVPEANSQNLNGSSPGTTKSLKLASEKSFAPLQRYWQLDKNYTRSYEDYFSPAAEANRLAMTRSQSSSQIFAAENAVK